MTPGRDDLDELLGAYALDAVDAQERQRVEEYLAHNPRARAEVEQHREVATMLSYTGAPAPEGLWDRIAEALDDRAPAPEPGPELAKVMPMPARVTAGPVPAPPVSAPALAPRSERRTRRSWTGVFGAAAAIVVALLSWRVVDVTRQLDDARAHGVGLERAIENLQQDSTTRRADLLSTDGRQTAHAYVAVDGTGYLDGRALVVLDPDHTYQLWGVVQGPAGQQVISLGVLGRQFDVAPFVVRQGTLVKLVLTEETRGGVPVSSQPAALAGDLI